MDYNETGGVWRTVAGRRIFIRNGQSVSEAMVESWKFSSCRRKTVRLDPKEYAHVLSELNTYYAAFKHRKVVGWFVYPNFYIFENYGFDQYNFFERIEIKEIEDAQLFEEEFDDD